MKIKQSKLNIASECFAKYGYDKTSLEILSTKMNIALSTFCYQFKNKDVVFRAVLDDEIEQFKNLIQRVIEKNTNPFNSICAYIAARTIGLQKSKNLVLVITNKSLSRKFLNHQIVQEFTERETEYLEDILQSGVENGLFQIEDITIGALAISSTLQSMEKELNQFSNIEKSIEKLYGILNIILFGIVKVKKDNTLE